MSQRFLKFLRWLPILSLPTIQQNLYTEGYTTSQQIETSIQRVYLSPLDVSVSDLKVLELDSGELGREVAAHLDTQMAGISSEKFNDGECNIQVLDCVRGHNVYLIKRFKSHQINDGIIELLITVNTLKKQGAAKVTCFIPFFPYSQSNDFQLEESKTFFTSFGCDILRMLEEAGCDRVITFNSLMSYPKGFVNQCAFININAPDLFVGHLATKQLKNPVLVSTYINTPNVNNLHILKQSLKILNYNCPISTFNDEQYIGDDVKGNDVILYSNMMRTGDSFIKLSKILEKMGARTIYGCAFHSLTSDDEIKDVVNKSSMKEILTTNSLPHTKSTKNLSTVSLGRLIAETITLFEEQKSLSEYRIGLEMKKMAFLRQVKHKNNEGIPTKVQQIL